MVAVNILDLEITRTERDIFLDDVLLGLMKHPRQLPSKYFYDERGQRLFEALCDTPEFYPRRSELAILRGQLAAITEAIGERSLLIQLGAGNMEQTRLLLNAMPALSGFVPVDSSCAVLERSAETIQREYRRQRISPVCADHRRDFMLPRQADLEARRVAYLPGAAISQQTPQQALQYLRQLARLCGRGGGVIAGVDLKKAPRMLTEAYNDKAGLSAALNLNILERINRELEAHFQIDLFSHYAFYNPRAGRVETHLVNFQDQIVHLGGVAIPLEMGETIWTQSAYVYTAEEFRALAAKAGMSVREVWVDSSKLFSVQYLTVD